MAEGINDLNLVVIWIIVWIQEFLKDILLLHPQAILEGLGFDGGVHRMSTLAVKTSLNYQYI